jgi:hypothetical protein
VDQEKFDNYWINNGMDLDPSLTLCPKSGFDRWDNRKCFSFRTAGKLIASLKNRVFHPDEIRKTGKVLLK